MKSDFLFYLMEASCCLTVFLGFYYLVQRSTTFYSVSRTYLLLTPALALAIPILQIGPAYTPAPTEALPAVNWNALPTAVGTVQGQIEENPGLADYFWVLYWLGSGLFAGLFLLRLTQLAIPIRKCRFDNYQRYRLALTGDAMPTVSFLHYLFWNNVQTLSRAEEEAILQHELTHIMERHTLAVLYVECLCSFLWFNLVVYLHRQALHQVHELRADQQASRQFGIDSYADLLKRTLLSRITISLSHSFNQSFTKRRIKMLHRPASVPSRLWVLLLLLPLTAVLFAAFTACQTPPLLSDSNSVTLDIARVLPPSIVIKAGKPGYEVPVDSQNGISKTKFPESLMLEAIPDPSYLKQNPKARFAVIEFEVFLVRGRRPVKYLTDSGDSLTSTTANTNWVSIARYKQLLQTGSRLIVDVKRVVRMDAAGRINIVGQTVMSPVFSILITE